MDVTEQKSIDDSKLMIEEQFGKLDVLINNAAILYDEWQRAEDANLNAARAAFETGSTDLQGVQHYFVKRGSSIP